MPVRPAGPGALEPADRRWRRPSRCRRRRARSPSRPGRCPDRASSNRGDPGWTRLPDNDLVHVEELLLFVLAAVAVVIVVRWVADKTGLPAAALLTLVGVVYALLPGPNVDLDPELVLTFVIPPLLYSAALDSSLVD